MANLIFKRMGDDGQQEYRCAPCVDSATFDTLADGTDYDCSYCGREHEDGLDSITRWMEQENVWHCDACLAFIAKGSMCEGCYGTEEVTGPVNLVKPFPKGARVMITHRGEQSEWVIIGRESRAGQHTGWVRVEYSGWLSASVREADVELIAEVPEVPIYICRDAKCQREVDGPGLLCYMHLCVVCDYDPRQESLPICEGCEQHARRTGRDVNAMIAAGYDVLAEYRAQERDLPEPMGV